MSAVCAIDFGTSNSAIALPTTAGAKPSVQLVELEPGRSLLDLIGLGEDLQAALGRRVDAVSKAGMKPRVLAQARRDAVRIV